MSKSNEEKRHYQDELGEEFGTAFYELWCEWVWGLLRLNEYRTLFSRSEDVRLLNDLLGGSFAWDIQQVFWDDLLLRICRLTDPVRSGGKDNLSITRLPAFCEKRDAGLHAKVELGVHVAVGKAKFARDWRNRRISHSDWQSAKEQGKPLAKATLQQLESALNGVHAVLNTISSRLMNVHLANVAPPTPRAGEFLANARQLLSAVTFIDALADQDGGADDNDAAITFLRKFGREPAGELVIQAIELREAAQKYKSTVWKPVQ